MGDVIQGIKGGALILGTLSTAAKNLCKKEAINTIKAINLPAWRKIQIDMGHVLERHTASGSNAAGRTTFPEMMNEKGIERAIREAYRHGERVGGAGDRILMRGSSGGLTIEMWVNRATSTIETAYPIVR